MGVYVFGGLNKMVIATDGIEEPKGKLKDKLGHAAAWTALFGGCGVVALTFVSASYKSEHVPLTDRLEQAYQSCQEIGDKSKEVAFASSVYASCQEVEDLYLKVKE